MNYELETDIANYADYNAKYNPTEQSLLLPLVNYNAGINQSNVKSAKNDFTVPLESLNLTMGITTPLLTVPTQPTVKTTTPTTTPTTATPRTTPTLKVSTGKAGDAKEMMNFLIGKGLKKEGAAGIVGNLMVESTLKTGLFGDKNTSFGLAQWRDPTPGKGRWTNLKNFTTSKGLDINSHKGQLEYLWHELNTDYKNVLNKLQNSTSAEEAADHFRIGFEKPAKNLQMETMRRDYSKKFYSLI